MDQYYGYYSWITKKPYKTLQELEDAEAKLLEKQEAEKKEKEEREKKEAEILAAQERVEQLLKEYVTQFYKGDKFHTPIIGKLPIDNPFFKF